MEYGNLAYKLPEQYDEPIKKRKPQKRKEKTAYVLTDRRK